MGAIWLLMCGGAGGSIVCELEEYGGWLTGGYTIGTDCCWAGHSFWPNCGGDILVS
jgi:hypothetical protein